MAVVSGWQTKSGLFVGHQMFISGQVRGTIDAMNQYSSDPVQVSNDLDST